MAEPWSINDDDRCFQRLLFPISKMDVEVNQIEFFSRTTYFPALSSSFKITNGDLQGKHHCLLHTHYCVLSLPFTFSHYTLSLLPSFHVSFSPVAQWLLNILFGTENAEIQPKIPDLSYIGLIIKKIQLPNIKRSILTWYLVRTNEEYLIELTVGPGEVSRKRRYQVK